MQNIWLRSTTIPNRNDSVCHSIFISLRGFHRILNIEEFVMEFGISFGLEMQHFQCIPECSSNSNIHEHVSVGNFLEHLYCDHTSKNNPDACLGNWQTK